MTETFFIKEGNKPTEEQLKDWIGFKKTHSI
jgi:hypothetical protein